MTEAKATKPFNFKGFLAEYFRREKLEKDEKSCLSQLVHEVVNHGRNAPIVKIDLVDLFSKTPEKMFEKFKEDVEEFLQKIENTLINEAKFDLDFKDIFNEKDKKAVWECVHIIPEYKNVFYIPFIENLDQNLTKFRNRIVAVRGRFMSVKLVRMVEYTKMRWRCSWCHTEFSTKPTYRQTTEDYKAPEFCLKKQCKARAKKSFDLLPDKCDTREKRVFSVIDVENQDALNEIECYISKNLDYFLEKGKHLHSNDEIEVLGILKLDVADFNNPKYYLEVIDFQPSNSLEIDEEIIKQIDEKIKLNPEYALRILDSIHPFSQGIYNFLPIKLLIHAAWASSNSFKEIRNSINPIIGGHSGTQKTRILLYFQKILGSVNVGKLDGKNTTKNGLVPVTQRNNNEKNLTKRYGALVYYNKKMFAIDESQYLYEKNPDALHATKALESGIISKTSDGIEINGEAKGSIILLLNYKSETEAFDYNLDPDPTQNLLKNLGFPEEKSVLDRFDAHYRIPVMSDVVWSALSKRDSDNWEPKFQVDMEEIKNYLLWTKHIYPKVTMAEEFENAVLKIFAEVVKSGRKRVRNTREQKALKKIIKYIAAMHFRTEVRDEDLIFLRKHLLNTIIPIQDNPYVQEQRIINLTFFFRQTFSILTELKKEISIPEHIDFFREFLNDNFFPAPQNSNGKTLDEVFPKTKEDNLSNTKYRRLLEENEEFIYTQGYIIGKINNTTHFIEKSLAIKCVYDCLSEISLESEIMDYSGTLQTIEHFTDYSKDLIKEILNVLSKNAQIKIVKSGNQKCIQFKI